MNQIKILLLSLILIIPQMLIAQDGWQDLFDGNSLDGWVQLGGEANYYAEDGAIVGEAVPDTPNSFLTTKEDYGDFILEFEVYLDSRINSGVQIRSESKPGYRNGRVHGYQVELDPSARAWSGGIYDEARRGWLYPLTYNEKAGSAIGAEFQILDDQGHPDADQGVAGNRTIGSLYDMIAAENLSVPGRGKPFNGVGSWNKARIISNLNNS